jgi:hypothetical protein
MREHPAYARAVDETASGGGDAGSKGIVQRADAVYMIICIRREGRGSAAVGGLHG